MVDFEDDTIELNLTSCDFNELENYASYTNIPFTSVKFVSRGLHMSI